MSIVRGKLACFCELQPIFAKCGRNWWEMQASFRKQRFLKMKSNVTGHIALSGGNGLTKTPCLIHWEWKWAGKATVMSVTALIVSATKNVAYCLLLDTNWWKRFLFCCLRRKWWKGSLSAGSVAFLFPRPRYASLPCYISALALTFCFLPWPLKKCWSISAVHPIRGEKRGEIPSEEERW